ncbi:hypothetical protein ACX80H_11020 [Arthrobacter sp. MDT2-2]
MNNPVGHPPHDKSADEELSASLAGHSHLSDDDDGSSAAPIADPSPEATDKDEASPVLEEIEDSPVRTENS